MTMGDSWGPIEDDDAKKPVRYLLTVLAEIAAAGGNLLLNASPLGDGTIPAWQTERFDAIADWMSRHSTAVLDTQPGLAPWQFHGPTTRRGSTVFLHCPLRPQELVVLRGVKGLHVTGVRAVGTDTPLSWDVQLSALDRIIGGRDAVCDVIISTPDDALDPLMTVIEVTFGG